jgi:crotonobetainyl-CoA:carnitine CoA-transferase CaiB-like acyl-CoA transferase
MNHGKQSIQADLSDALCIQGLRTLILEQADVVIQNLKPGSLERNGLGAEALTEAKPSLIYCNLGAFGAVGPLRDKPGYDPLAQAYSGIMSVLGNEGDAMSRVPVSLNDMGTGMWTVIGVLSALRSRDTDPEKMGQIVDVSLYETALAWMTVPLSDNLAGAALPTRNGSGSPNIVPYQVFTSADGDILVAAGNDVLYAKLCHAMNLPALAKDPRFITNGGRVEHRVALIELLQKRFKDLNSDQWLSLLEAASIPCGPIQTVDRVVANPQTKALDILRTTPDGKVTTVALPISFDGQRPPLPGNTPGLGEHNYLLNTPHKNSNAEK